MAKRKPAKKIIHINKSMIGCNVKDGGHRPTITLKRSGKPATYARGAEILGPSKLVQSDTPLSCGARVWIETTAPVKLTDEMSFKEAQEAVTLPEGGSCETILS